MPQFKAYLPCLKALHSSLGSCALVSLRPLELTLKAFWDVEGSVVTGAGHRTATPLGSVQTIEDNTFSMEDSVGFQVCNPEPLGIVESTASFDANCAGSWLGKNTAVKAVGYEIAISLKLI